MDGSCSSQLSKMGQKCAKEVGTFPVIGRGHLVFWSSIDPALQFKMYMVFQGMVFNNKGSFIIVIILRLILIHCKSTWLLEEHYERPMTKQEQNVSDSYY